MKVIEEIKPHILITYDEIGGYGHPDHIQAHRVATYARTLAAAPSFAPELGAPWQITKVYWTAFPVSVMRAGIEMLQAAGEDTGFAAQDPDDIPFACPDELVTTAIDGGEFAAQKLLALRAHATQISTDEGFFALSNNLGAQVLGTEYYRLVAGTAAGPYDDLGRETDLFNGLTELEVSR